MLYIWIFSNKFDLNQATSVSHTIDKQRFINVTTPPPPQSSSLIMALAQKMTKNMYDGLYSGEKVLM
jgi:hypothetical protein